MVGRIEEREETEKQESEGKWRMGLITGKRKRLRQEERKGKKKRIMI